MKLLDHYILRTVLFTLLLVLLVLAGLDTLFSFIAELEDLSPSYQLEDAAIYAVATFPRRCYEFIPVATLIGCLLSLGMLANSSELVVMRAAGVSVARIVFSVLKAVLIIVVAGLVLGQYVMPQTERYAQSYRALQQGGGSTLKVKHGNWQRDGDSFIHVNAIAPDGIMYGVTHYKVSEANQLLETGFSKRADYLGPYESSGHEASERWRLTENRVTILEADRIRVEQPKQFEWQTNLNPKLINLVVLKPDFLSITGLHQYAQHMRSEGLSFKPYLLAFWKKIMQPFATLTMIVIAVSFVFGPLRSVTMGLRVMVGLVVGLVFNYAQDFLGFASLVFNIQPWAAATLPVICFAVVGVVLISRVR